MGTIPDGVEGEGDCLGDDPYNWVMPLLPAMSVSVTTSLPSRYSRRACCSVRSQPRGAWTNPFAGAVFAFGGRLDYRTPQQMPGHKSIRTLTCPLRCRRLVCYRLSSFWQQAPQCGPKRANSARRVTRGARFPKERPTDCVGSKRHLDRWSSKGV